MLQLLLLVIVYVWSLQPPFGVLFDAQSWCISPSWQKQSHCVAAKGSVCTPVGPPSLHAKTALPTARHIALNNIPRILMMTLH
jgi:hypothetical protein